mmetsp:Transcript_24384/g.68491  ORF Transcript_24384/g.68491 Transcript_24384/m.68491 type:complete len:261 (-) Transcript_24384:1198-1980(-)
MTWGSSAPAPFCCSIHLGGGAAGGFGFAGVHSFSSLSRSARTCAVPAWPTWRAIWAFDDIIFLTPWIFTGLACGSELIICAWSLAISSAAFFAWPSADGFGGAVRTAALGDGSAGASDEDDSLESLSDSSSTELSDSDCCDLWDAGSFSWAPACSSPAPASDPLALSCSAAFSFGSWSSVEAASLDVCGVLTFFRLAVGASASFGTMFSVVSCIASSMIRIGKFFLYSRFSDSSFFFSMTFHTFGYGSQGLKPPASFTFA